MKVTSVLRAVGGASEKVVYFDGVCNLCSCAVDFIIRHDSAEQIHFASLQSSRGQRVLQRLGLPASDLKTIVFEQDGELFVKSAAAMKVVALLDRPVCVLGWFQWIPRCLRDPIYMFISKNRYRWFGKKSSCRLPSAGQLKRFID